MDNFAIKDWYLWPCQAFSGATNMQLDHLLARQLGKSVDRPILRFFTWDPFCISLGFHQKTSDINQELCTARSLEIVRRPTGGRAILHAEELTYSVVYPVGDLDVAEFYRLIHIPMVTALQEWGIPAEFQPAQADFRNIYKTDRAFLCFAASAQYEVEIKGKKLIGSAQRIYENAILQHGSILLGPAHKELVNLLNMNSQQKIKMEQYLRDHTVCLWEYDPGISAANLANQLENHFKKHYHLHFTPLQENQQLFSILHKQAQVSEFAILEQPPKSLLPSAISEKS